MTEEIQGRDFVYSLATSPDFSQDGICFAGKVSGLYRSDDGGANWRSLYDSLNIDAPLATPSVVVSPAFPSDQTVIAGVQGGVLRSMNGGESWDFAPLPPPPPLVSTLTISPNFQEDGVLLAGTVEDGVRRSGYQGRHWTIGNFGLLDLNTFSMALSPDFAEDETVFVGTETGVFRSTNGARAWRETEFPMESAPVISLAVSPGYARDGTVLAGTEAHGLYISDDRGKTWVRLGEDAIAGAVNGIVLSSEFPAKPHVLVLLESALLISRDKGQSWAHWKDGLRLDQGTAALAAPQGLNEGAPILIGLVGGEVLRV
jgi:hypothetical protein